MLSNLFVKNLPGLTDVDWYFEPGLTCITGDIGTGKTMRTRDILLLLLAGRIPSKRTIACLGKRMQAGVVLQRDGQSLSVLRSGTSTSILEDSKVSGTGVKDRVAQFTGISPTVLPDLCYCSGMHLQQSMQLNSALLATIRSAMGGQIQAFAKVISAALSEANARLASTGTPEDANPETVRQELEAVRDRLTAAQASLTEAASHVDDCRAVMNCTLDSDRALQRDACLKFLGHGWASMSYQEMKDLARDESLYEACQTIAKELQASLSGLDLSRHSPTLHALVQKASKVQSAGGDAAPDWDKLLEARLRLDSVREMATVSEAQREQAIAYLKYHGDLVQFVQACSAEVKAQERTLQLIEAQARASEQAASKRKQAEVSRQRFSLLQELLLPSGKHSLEKKLIDDISVTLLSAASDYMNMCGLSAVMTYEPSAGIGLLRRDGPVKSQELSEGESMIASLCLRLALIRTVQPTPFLVLDDITGSMGWIVSRVTDMLRIFAREQNIPVILNTQELRVTGDRIYGV